MSVDRDPARTGAFLAAAASSIARCARRISPAAVVAVAVVAAGCATPSSSPTTQLHAARTEPQTLAAGDAGVPIFCADENPAPFEFTADTPNERCHARIETTDYGCGGFVLGTQTLRADGGWVSTTNCFDEGTAFACGATARFCGTEVTCRCRSCAAP